jgi:hypothetical protein
MAGVQVGVGYIDIRPDLSGFGRQLRNEVTRDVARTGDEASRSLKNSFAGAAKGAAAAFGAAFAAVKIKDFLGGAIQAASDLNEQVSKSNAVFDSAGVAVEGWASDAAENIGLSKRAALDAASTFGNMFVQLGVSSTQAATLSKSIVELGVDFRSFTNADITEILQAQSAAFRGEYDSLQRFLPLINAAAVSQRAMELTGKKNADQLTAQDKALATYRLMVEGAGDAAGDFDRTQDSLANQQQKLSAQWENAKSDLGEGLLPAMTAVTKFVTDEMLPAFKTLFTGGEGDATGWAATIRNAINDTLGFLVGTLQQVLRLMANVTTKIPFGWGDDAAADFREAADGADEWRVMLHASKAELIEWAGAYRNADAAAKLLAPAVKDTTAAMKESVGATKASAKAAEDAAKAERDLLGVKRDIADAERGLVKAQKERDKAAAAFAILGTDTAADELADAEEGLADAKDSVADARDRELDVKERIADLEAKTISGTSAFVNAVDARKDAVKALNDQLGITKEHLGILGDPGNILGGLKGAAVIPQPAAAAPAFPPTFNPSFGVAPSANLGISIPNVPRPTVTNNLIVNSTQPVPDPALLSKEIAWAIAGVL